MKCDGGNERLKFITDDFHNRRVEGHADSQKCEPITFLLQYGSEFFDRLGVAAQDDLGRRIDISNVNILPILNNHLVQQFQGSVRGGHDAGISVQGGGLVHANCPLVHDAKSVLQGIDTGQAQGGQFAQTMAGHGHGADTKTDEVLSHRVFHGEQGRLLPPSFLKILFPIMKQQFKQIKIRRRCRPIHPLLDDGKSLVKFLAHAGVVGSLSGKNQSERCHAQILGADEDSLLCQ